MKHKPQLKIPATYMRGGTSKGVFFNLTDLPEAAQVPGEARDNGDGFTGNIQRKHRAGKA